MSTKIERQNPQAQQVSGKDPEGNFILSVIAKRSYVFDEKNNWTIAPTQTPLHDDPIFDKDHPDLLLHDSDLYPFKPKTDIVIKGHAHGRDGARQLDVLIRVGKATQQIAVFGDRQCTRTAGGALVFSVPEPIDRIPLCFTRAYGGRDITAEAEHQKQHLSKIDGHGHGHDLPIMATKSQVRYPRNPCGRGYLITATDEALAALKLPNLEDPGDLLTPERLEAGSAQHWPRMPIPQATGWIAYDWFPRVMGAGMVPLHDAASLPFTEVKRKILPESAINNARTASPDAFFMTCGASLAMQTPYLRGNEKIELQNLHPQFPSLSLRLPGEPPRIWTDGRKGNFNKTRPVIHTLIIEPEEMRVTFIWRGSAEALRPYMPDELKKMPFRVEWE